MKRLSRTHLFDSTDLSLDLGRKSLHGGVTTMASQGTLFVLNLLRSIILARLLVPSDFGLVGMVTVLLNFAIMFKNAGLSMATVQSPRITEGQISSLFWVNVGISCLIGIVIALCAPAVAVFYGKPQLIWVTVALAVPFVLSGLQIQHLALLRRHMLFSQIAVINIGSQFFSVVVAVFIAVWGGRYWALVGAQWATAVTALILTFYFCPWLPGRFRRRTGIRSMLVFGGHLTGFTLVNYFARNLDNILIGRFLGAEALGYYDRAYKLMMQPLQNLNGPLSAVGIPSLSRLQDEPGRYRYYFERAASLLLLVTMPLAAFLLVAARDIIITLFGSQWEASAVPFRWLALCIINQPLGNITGWLYMSQGRTKDMMHWGIIGSSITVVSFIVGLHWGINGVAAVYASVGMVLATPLSFYFCGRQGPVAIRLLFSLFLKKIPFFIGFVLLHVAVSLIAGDLNLSPPFTLGIQSIAYGVAMCCVFFLAADAKSLRERIRDLKTMRS